MTASKDDGSKYKPDNKLVKAFLWATNVDPETCKAQAEAKRRKMSGKSPQQVAKAIVASYARKGGLEGFVTGLPTNLLVALPGALTDAGVLLRFFATMNGTLGYLANPDYFDDPDWRHDLLVTLAGAAAIGKIFQELGISFSKQAAKQIIRTYIGKEVLRALKRWVLKWFGKKVTQRAIIAKAVPFIGALIGGTWNYFEIKAVGRRIFAYHFQDTLS
jgi:hypothetical protein